MCCCPPPQDFWKGCDSRITNVDNQSRQHFFTLLLVVAKRVRSQSQHNMQETPPPIPEVDVIDLSSSPPARGPSLSAPRLELHNVDSAPDSHSSSCGAVPWFEADAKSSGPHPSVEVCALLKVRETSLGPASAWKHWKQARLG